MNKNRQGEYVQNGVAMTCRSYQEYVDMFQLTHPMLSAGPILDVAGGASSFTAEASARGFQAFAADPQYAEDSQVILDRGRREIRESTDKLRDLQAYYHWDYYGSLERHQQQRIASLEMFAKDYTNEASCPPSNRYVAAKLPSLPYSDAQFQTVLCSHFLFLYEAQFDFQFHIDSVQELIRVCRPGGRVLIYPLASFRREPYAELAKLMSRLSTLGHTVELKDTPFRFLEGATEVLQVRKR